MAGDADSLALFRYVSVAFRFTMDPMLPRDDLGAIGRVYVYGEVGAAARGVGGVKGGREGGWRRA